MTSDIRQRAREIFMELADLPEPDQAAALERACGENVALRVEVELLLRAEVEARGFMASPTADSPEWAEAKTATSSTPLREGPGSRIGPYKILQLIGEGGFGSVFMAEQQQPVQRKVALKIIKLGMDTREVVARFEQERQALALMDHPNIAKVFDAGATGTGRPFFVMELCKGDPIVEYCDKNNLTILDRLELFAQVCNAVQHAHGKGIIHRDIKPSNVIVSTQDGRAHAKVIDFGIAKATASKLTEKTLFTEHRQLIGTPEYMSPEQAEGSLDIDTRTDVYSLGVLLYELLTGTTPFSSMELRSAAFAEIQRIIREVEPPKPSTRLNQNSATIASIAAKRHTEPKRLGTLVRGELDWIVMKALEKDRQRRYETANGLAMDVRRYLSGEAVLAAPPSAAYRAKKFVRRNRPQVFAAGAVTLALALGLVATGIMLARALRAESGVRIQLAETERAQQAERARADELKQVSDFQASMLSQIDTARAGVELMADLRERFVAALMKSGVPEGERAARLESLRAELARVNATDTAAAMIDRTILRPAVETIDVRFKGQPLVDAQLRQALAELYRAVGLYESSSPLQNSALATRRRILGQEHPDTLGSMRLSGALLRQQGKLPEAEQMLREAFGLARRVLAEEHPERSQIANSLGVLLGALGNDSDAEQMMRETLEVRRRVLGEDHPDTIDSINNMGALLSSVGRLTEAEPYYAEALVKSRRVLGNEHPATIGTIGNMGALLLETSRPDAAEPFFREALESSRRALGEEHPATLQALNNLAVMLRQQGRLAEAEPYHAESLEKCRKILGDDHPATLEAIGSMAALRWEQGRAAEAELLFREAMQGHRAVLGREHPDTLVSINNLAIFLLDQDRLAEAEPYVREALEMGRRVLGEEHPNMLTFINNMGGLLRDQGKFAESEPYLRDALARRRAVLGDDHPATLTSIESLISLLRAQGRLAEAEPYQLEALQISRRLLGEDHPEVLASILGMGILLWEQGKLTEAEAYYLEAVDKCKRVLGSDHPHTIIAINSLGVLFGYQDKLDQAELYLREAMEGFRRVMGEEHPNTLISVSSLGGILLFQRRFQDAIDLLAPAEPAARRALTGTAALRLGTFLDGLGLARVRLGYDAERFALAESNLLEAHAILVSTLGQNHVETLNCVRGVVEMYTVWHAAEPANGHDSKVEKWKAMLPDPPAPAPEQEGTP